MAYNYKSIEEFLNKVDKEAAEAAQAVYDKYEPEFLKRVQSQLKENDVVFHANGTCTIQKKEHAENNKDVVVTKEVGLNLSDILGQYQYNKVEAGMTLSYKFDKTQVLED